MRSTLLIFLASIFSISLQAQQECGFEKSHQMLLQSNTSYRQSVEKGAKEWAKFAVAASQQKLLITGNDTIFEIPVVIHVIHTGGAIGTQYNPTDQQLIDLIDFTNKCFQASWPSYPDPQSGGTYVPFRFSLAKRDPNCAATNGIVRIDGSGLTDYAADGIQLGAGPGASETAVKALSVWPNDKYYNIWVVNHIGGPSGGTAGYAYFPGAGPTVDGTVILASVAQSGSSTLAHEIGHGMGLSHTFEGDAGGATCPTNNNCNTDGDGICDTEPHMRGASCTDVTNPCTNAPFTFTRNSFMSYTHGCRDRFSAGQRNKMKFNLRTYRTVLMLSHGAEVPPPAAIAACLPTSLNPGSTQNYGPQLVALNTIFKTSGGYDSEGIYEDNFCEGRTELYTGNSYLMTVKTGPNAEDVKVFIDYDNDGTFSFSETVLSSNGTTANQVHTGTVSIPTSGVTLCQPLRMRVVSDIASAPFLFACGPLDLGQAEDYVVTLKPPTTATIAAVSATTYPYCRDSAVTFTTSSVNVPPNAYITWLLNGSPVASGPTFTTSTLQPGDVIQAKTFVNNATCNTPDTITSAALAVTFLPGPPAPVLSFINGDIVSNIAPVRWFGPNGLIPGITGSVYHPTQPGNYYAVAIGNPCPSDSSNVLNVSLLDIDNIEPGGLSVYPNPATAALTIETKMWEDGTITLKDAQGRTLQSAKLTGSKTVLSVEGLANGLYFLQLADANGKISVRKLQVLH